MIIGSPKNKQMILEIMEGIIKENNIVTKVDLKEFISDRCNYFHTKRFEFPNASEINKKIVGLCYHFILANSQKQSSAIPSPPKVEMSKREMFDKGLEIQQNNFDKMIQPKKPTKIDFTDGGKDFPMDNLGVIMNQTLADRQAELQVITQQYTKKDQETAQKWFSSDKSEDDIITSQNTPKIQIDRNSSVDLDNAINVNLLKKRVHFQIEENPDEIENRKNDLRGFLSKLKKKSSGDPKTNINELADDNNTNNANSDNNTNDTNSANSDNNTNRANTDVDIIKKLDTIISNQEKIINFFWLADKQPTI